MKIRCCMEEMDVSHYTSQVHFDVNVEADILRTKCLTLQRTRLGESGTEHSLGDAYREDLAEVHG